MAVVTPTMQPIWMQLVPDQMIELTDPYLAVGKNGMILLRDNQQLLEIKINLSAKQLNLLKYKLNSLE
jgi:hypothetical protein